jgi:hypothetical protein
VQASNALPKSGRQSVPRSHLVRLLGWLRVSAKGVMRFAMKVPVQNILAKWLYLLYQK